MSGSISIRRGRCGGRKGSDSVVFIGHPSRASRSAVKAVDIERIDVGLAANGLDVAIGVAV